MLTTTLAYFTSTQDWLIIGVIVLVLFGSTKIPQFAKGIGEGIREFKKSVNPNDPEDRGDTTTTTTRVVEKDEN